MRYLHLSHGKIADRTMRKVTDAVACAICLEEKPCATLPCCGREGSSLMCCSACIRTICDHEGLGRCPVCRAMLAVVDGAVIRAHHARGRCASCWAENVPVVEPTLRDDAISHAARCTTCVLYPDARIRRLRRRALASLRRLARMPLDLASMALSAALSGAVELFSSALNCREAGFASYGGFAGYDDVQ